MKSKRANVRLVQHVLSLLTALILTASGTGQTVAGGQPAQELFANIESVTMTGILRNPSMPFVLEVKCAPLGKRSTIGGSDISYLGTDGEDPWCVVQKIALSLNSKVVKFPAASYSELANVGLSFGVQLKNQPEFVTLLISGGDGAGSYKARFIIRGGRLMAREIEDLDEQGEVRLTKKSY